MQFNNPISSEKFDHLLAELWLNSSSNVLDVGCGQGELLLRIMQTFHCHAVGVDPDKQELDIARKKLQNYANSITLYDCPFQSLPFGGMLFDACFSVAASHAFGRRGSALEGAISSLKSLTKPGGMVIIGDGYWKKEPALEYLQASEIEAREFRSHAECIKMGEESGMQCVYTMKSSMEEWDHFEGSFWMKSERELIQDPGNDEVKEKVQRRRIWKQAYFKWGRETLGFSLFVFLVPMS